MLSSPYVPDNCSLSPYEDEPDEYTPVCAICGGEIIPGYPHVICRGWEDA